MNGVIYTRVSSDEQITGTSLAFQEELCRKYCGERGIAVLEVFREEGQSAKTADRTELLRALEFCRRQKGTVQAFVVAKVDRFARNTEDHFFVRKLLLGYGVTLHSVTEPIGNSPTEKFVETVLAASAEFDNAIRKQRCTDGMIARISQGIWPFQPPIGYLCFGHKKRGEKKTRPDQPHMEIFPIMQRALKSYAKGEIRSQAAFRELLDSWGLARIRGTQTRPQLVDWILGRYLRFYAGILVNPWSGDEHRGLHQPMISEAELLRIQLVRAGKLPHVTRKRDRFNPSFPLRRTVRCFGCARFLTGGLSRGNGGTYPYYFCPNKSCTLYGKAIRKAVLDTDFRAFLVRITPHERFFTVFDESVREAMRNQGELRAREGEQQERKLSELASRRKRVFEMREDGTYTKDEFKERISELEMKIAAIKNSDDDHGIYDLDLERALVGARCLAANVSGLWFDLPPSVRGRFEQLVLPDGIAYSRDHGFRTAQLGLLFELNRRSRGGKSQVVHLVGNRLNQVMEYLRELSSLRELLPAAGLPDDASELAA